MIVILKDPPRSWNKPYYDDNYHGERQADSSTTAAPAPDYHQYYVGFINTDRRHSNYPNIQFEYVIIPKGKLIYDNTFFRKIGYNKMICENITRINRDNTLLIPLIKNIHPKSMGYIQLESTRPYDQPLIYPNYLTDQLDVENYLAGIRYNEMLLQTSTFGRYKPQVVDLQLPECAAEKFDSDNYWKCYLKFMTYSENDHCGTAKMGPRSDSSAVVDPRLKVHGVECLRVADESIMPKIPTGNKMAASIMIGEKAADMIKEDWKDQK